VVWPEGFHNSAMTSELRRYDSGGRLWPCLAAVGPGASAGVASICAIAMAAGRSWLMACAVVRGGLRYLVMTHGPGQVVVDNWDSSGATSDPEPKYAHDGPVAGEPEDDEKYAHACSLCKLAMTWLAGIPARAVARVPQRLAATRNFDGLLFRTPQVHRRLVLDYRKRPAPRGCDRGLRLFPGSGRYLREDSGFRGLRKRTDSQRVSRPLNTSHRRPTFPPAPLELLQPAPIVAIRQAFRICD
jgi:hypothetical protein